MLIECASGASARHFDKQPVVDQHGPHGVAVFVGCSRRQTDVLKHPLAELLLVTVTEEHTRCMLFCVRYLIGDNLTLVRKTVHALGKLTLESAINHCGKPH